MVAALLHWPRQALADWNAAGVEAVVRGSAERTATSSWARSHNPLRAALTGKTTSPPIFDVLAVLGRAREPGAAAGFG